MTDSISELTKALVAFHVNFDGVAKNGRNGGFKNQQTGQASSYMTLDDILDTIRKPLAKVGLVVTQRSFTRFVETADGRNVVAGVQVVTLLMHSSGEHMEGSCEVPVSAPTAHAIGSAMTYARRYGITALLAISSDADDDGNGASGVNTQPLPARPKLTPIGQRGQ
jgi:hypothetical protein